MTPFGLPSYLLAALFFGLFAVLLSTSWRGRLQGGLLLAAVIVSSVWAGLGSVAGSEQSYISLQQFLALEVLRNTLWIAFLWHLLSFTKIGEASNWRQPVVFIFIALIVITIASELSSSFALRLNELIGIELRILSHVMQAVVGLVLVEQLFRNTRLELRWAIKFLCIGLGVLFAYDFVLFTESLLFARIDPYIWDGRGMINALVVPFIAVSASRNPQWSVDIFVSRSMIFHTTGLMATGVYLLVAALVGYYIRDYGGSWGRIGQVVFVVGALVLLLALMFSGQIRARVRVFFNRHFFAYKYDYRKEWLDLIQTISVGKSADELREACIRGASDIVDSASGAMWLKRERGNYELVAEVNLHPGNLAKVNKNDPLVKFLSDRKWVIEIPEFKRNAEIYEGLDLHRWYNTIVDLWLIIPLIHQDQLYGWIALGNPRAPRDINWEDRDLLKTVGQQLASYVGLIDASDELASARQFEAYNRLSAFIVHDLKNLVAQLSLIVDNAPKHKNNPEFVDDAIDTLTNSVGKMNRLLAQLRQGKIPQGSDKRVNLYKALKSVVEQQNKSLPLPQIESEETELVLITDPDKLVAILGHLVQNAQDATADEGFVTLRLSKLDNQAIIEIRDNGTGMDSRFVRDRLFKPFDTTKGNAGMGIGVFEARQYVTGLGGSIDVESTPGEGTTFSLKFPL